MVSNILKHKIKNLRYMSSAFPMIFSVNRVSVFRKNEALLCVFDNAQN